MSTSKKPAHTMPTKAAEPLAASPKRLFTDDERSEIQIHLMALARYGNLKNSLRPEDACAAWNYLFDNTRILIDDNVEAVFEEYRDRLDLLKRLLELKTKPNSPDLEKAKGAFTALHYLTGKGKVRNTIAEARKQAASQAKVTAAAEVKAAPSDKRDEPKKVADRETEPAAIKKTAVPATATAPATAAAVATEQKKPKAVAGARKQKKIIAPTSTPRQPQKIATEQRNAAVVKRQTPSVQRPSFSTATTTKPSPPKSESQPATKSSPTSVSPDNSAFFAPFGAPVITTVFSCTPIAGEGARPLPVEKKVVYEDAAMQTVHSNPHAQHKDKPKDKSAIEVVRSLNIGATKVLLKHLDSLKLRGDVTIDQLRQSLKIKVGDQEAACAEASGSRMEKQRTASQAQTAPRVPAAPAPSTTPVARTAPRSTGTLAVTAAAARNTVATIATATTAAPGTTVRKVNSVRNSNAVSKSDEARKRTFAAEKKTLVKNVASLKNHRAIQEPSDNSNDNESDAPSRKRKRNTEKTSQAQGGRKRHCSQHVVDGSEDEDAESSERRKVRKQAPPAFVSDSRKRKRSEPEPESEEGDEDLSDLEEEPFKKRRTDTFPPRRDPRSLGPRQSNRESGHRFQLSEDAPSPLEMGGILDAIRRPNRQPPDLNAELAEKDRIGAKAKAVRKEEERRRRD